MIPRYYRRTIKKGWGIGLKNNYDYVAVPLDKLKTSLMIIHKPDEGESQGYMIANRGIKKHKPHIQRGSQGLPDQKMAYVRWAPHKKKSELSVTGALQSTMTLEKLQQMKLQIFGHK